MIGVVFLVVMSLLGAFTAPATASTGTDATIGSVSERAVVADNDSDFRVGPDVSLTPAEGSITEDEPGQIELFVNNPQVNDATLVAEVKISVPRGVRMTGADLASGSGAKTVVAQYTIPPGTSRTITMNVYPSETGDVAVDGRVLYWPEGNKDAFNQLSMSNTFTVTSVPDAPDNAVGPGQTNERTTTTEVPPPPDGPGIIEQIISGVAGSFIGLVAVGGLSVAVVVFAWKSGAVVELIE
jgi:hypothetical protein